MPSPVPEGRVSDYHATQFTGSACQGRNCAAASCAMAIAYANEGGAERILVICPANIRVQWARKIAEWTTMPWT